MDREHTSNLVWMRDAILRHSDLVLPSSQLCNQCEQYDLESWLFRRQEKSAFGFVDVPYHPGESRTWDSVFANFTECTFCHLILFGLAQDERFLSQTFSGNMAEIRLSLGLSGLVITKQHSADVDLNTSKSRVKGWYRQDNEIYRGVMYIDVLGIGDIQRTSAQIQLFPHVQDRQSVDNLLSQRKISDVAIDIDLPKCWLATCGELHSKTCQIPHWPEMKDSSLHLIDVQRRCIVKVQSQLKYFALSYCWGDIAGRSFLKLTTTSWAQLSLEGALSDEHPLLPQTMRDAILVTHQMGYRYLWIDALCILQDDEADKQRQIDQMDKIYIHASLTIVAADGEDAWTGLPGVRIGSRQIQQISRMVGNVNLSFRHPRSFADSIQHSRWAGRAWTLQEQVLSNRLLIFRDYEIYWQCGDGLWEEGRDLECHLFESTRLDGLDADLSLSILDHDWTPFQRYNFLMNGISRRKLSTETDRLRCMQGLLNYMTSDVPGGFIWGMPVAALDSALLFHQGIWIDAPYERRSGFPSWCWAGWMETTMSGVVGPYDVGFSDDRLNDTSPFGRGCPAKPTWVRKEVAWYTVNSHATGWHEVQTAWITAEGSTSYLQSIRMWRQNRTASAIDAVRARFTVANTPLSYALACWTQSVYLHVDRLKPQDRNVSSYKDDRRGTGGSNKYHGLVVRDHEGRSIGGILLDPNYRSSRPDKLYFILIAQNRRWNDKLGPLLDLLHVETINGITYRVQTIRDATISPSIWVQLNPKWEFIVMA